MSEVDRRTFISLLGGTAAAVAAWPLAAADETAAGVIQERPVKKRIPSSGEALTVVGMGTWRTFNVGGDVEFRNDRTRVLEAFFRGGGQVVDSSPMYGSSQDVMGYAFGKLGRPGQLFAADKVWTRDGGETRGQIARSAAKWRVKRFDLMQVHNLLSWEAHLDTLEAMKEAGEVRYIGITTSHGRRHGEFERVMETRDLDFIQLTYNMVDREAENRLLPLAQEKGIAVIANRPFRGGGLVDRLQRGNKPLPGWAGGIGCENWPQYLLKFIVSHPAVTCAIPATTRVGHMNENMGAAYGLMPDAGMRRRMLDYLDTL